MNPSQITTCCVEVTPVCEQMKDLFVYFKNNQISLSINPVRTYRSNVSHNKTGSKNNHIQLSAFFSHRQCQVVARLSQSNSYQCPLCSFVFNRWAVYICQITLQLKPQCRGVCVFVFCSYHLRLKMLANGIKTHWLWPLRVLTPPPKEINNWTKTEK